VRLLFSKRQFSCAPATLRVQGHAPTLAAGEQSGRRPTEFSPPDVPRGGISLLRHRPAPGKNLKILCRISQEMGFDLPILRLYHELLKPWIPPMKKPIQLLAIALLQSFFVQCALNASQDKRCYTICASTEAIDLTFGDQIDILVSFDVKSRGAKFILRNITYLSHASSSVGFRHDAAFKDLCVIGIGTAAVLTQTKLALPFGAFLSDCEPTFERCEELRIALDLDPSQVSQLRAAISKPNARLSVCKHLRGSTQSPP
jgi:hypothetical protein